MAHIAFVHANVPGIDAIRCAKEAGHRVSFVRSPPQMYIDSPESTRIVDSVDYLLDIENTSDEAQVIAALRRCAAQHPLDVALTQSEWAVEATALACRALDLPFTSAAGALAARRKQLCREKLRAAGVPSARFALARSPDEAVQAAAEIGYPVIAKPASGTDSLLAFVARDAAAVREATEQILQGAARMPAAWQEQLSRGVLLEELLRGRLVSAEIGIRGEEHHRFCISGRFRGRQDETIELGSCIPAAISPAEAEECFAYALDVCRTIGLDRGIFHIEMILTDRGPVLVEANPRLMGGGMPRIYEYASGYNIHRSLLQLFTGAPIVGYPREIARFAAGMKLEIRDAGGLPATISLDWLRDYPARLVHFDNYSIRPLRPVKAGEVVGRVFVNGDDRGSALRTLDEILARMEATLGLELIGHEGEQRM